jgi:hypothetical protein
MEKNQTFASVLIFDVTEGDFDRLSAEVSRLLARKGSDTPGLIEGALLGNEARTQLWLISEWESRDAWAIARWDRTIDETLTDLVESAMTYRVEGLVPISVVRRHE